ncbi:cytochrome P450-dit2 [Apophysomyces sp. BC1021]|nr:cytochrome P450-dit2 [Apophysomyces sp. BC1021]
MLDIAKANVLLQKTSEIGNIITRYLAGHRRVSISSAVALTVLYLIYDKINKPPRSLRHIPYVGYINTITSALRGRSSADISSDYSIPLIKSEAHNGVYMRTDRIGWTVQVASPEAAKKVLMKIDLFPKADIKFGREGTVSAKFIAGPNILLTNGHEWKKHRKIANPAFHRSMPVKVFGGLTQQLFHTLEKEGTNNVDIVSLMERFTLDAIGQAGFDFDFRALSDNENSEWVRTYNDVKSGLRDPFFFFFPAFDQYFLWLFPKRRRIHKQVDKFNQMTDNVIQHKRKVLEMQRANHIEDNEKDLLTLMMETEIDGEKLTNDELKSNINIFFLAGHDTTANALAFGIYYLAVHKDIQEKARQEAIRILGSEPNDILPTVEQTKEMNYINMIMKETMRIDGPVSAVIPRRTAEDLELSGYFIPKDTALAIDIYALHHNPNVWEDPEKFDPERFAPGGEAENMTRGGLSWLPFSNGGRQCIGMNFSLVEQRVLLSMLLRKYTWELPADSIHRDKLVTKNVGIISGHNLNINFKERY